MLQKQDLHSKASSWYCLFCQNGHEPVTTSSAKSAPNKAGSSRRERPQRLDSVSAEFCAQAFAWLAAHLGHQRQAHCLSSGARDRLKPWRLFASLPLPALLKSMAVDGRLAFEVTMAEPPPRVAVFSVDLSFDSYFQQRSTFAPTVNSTQWSLSSVRSWKRIAG